MYWLILRHIPPKMENASDTDSILVKVYAMYFLFVLIIHLPTYISYMLSFYFVALSSFLYFSFSACLCLLPWHEQLDSRMNVSKFIFCVCSFLYQFLIGSDRARQFGKKTSPFCWRFKSFPRCPWAGQWISLQLQAALCSWPWPLTFAAKNNFSTEFKACWDLFCIRFVQ